MKKILSRVRRAVDDYGMIKDGDKIAVGVSGGKDSLTLLCALAALKKFYPNRFELIAVSLDMGFEGMDYGGVAELCESLEVEYILKKTDIAEIIFDIRKEKNPCSLCAKMRRGALNNKAIELGFNKLALGHHADDVVQTMLLSLLYEGRFSTFQPVSFMDRSGITLIRPFIYTSESDVKGAVNKLNLPALPFFLAVQPDRYKAMDAILAGKSGKMMTQAVEKKGVKIIGWAENGFRELTTSKGPITKPEDLRGLKIRVVGSPIFIETFRALGANPVNMNWSEATTGFQQGVVDGQENPTNGINIPLKIWDYHKFHCDWHYIIDPLMLGVNPRVWKSFSPEDQKLLLECAAETEKYGKALSRLGMDDGSALAYLKSINKLPETTDCYAVMEANGMTVSRLSNEQIAALAKATEGVRKDWTAKIGADLVKAAEEDMASVR